MIRLFTCLLVLCFALPADAQLTPAQRTTLHTLAAADPTASGYLANGQDNELAAWYNVGTGYIVWRGILTSEVMEAAIVSGAIQLDNLTVGKRDTLLWLASRDVDNTASLRTALDDLCGTQATLKAAVVAAEKRQATRAEQALATGSGTTLSPSTLGWEGMIDQYEASLIRSQ